jgi:tetratricopeptide (TPR) repeat protein
MSALRPLFVFGGGLLGFLVAIPIALLTGAPAKYPVLYIGLPPAIATGAILAGWVQRGRMSAGLAAVGLLVLLVNLLAAGGIGLPGVAGTLWVLLALGLSLLERDAPRPLPRGTAMGLLAVSVGLSVACYASGYSPVLRCYAAMESARYDPSHQEEHLQEAALADPLSAEPWSQLAALALDGWKQAVGGSSPRVRVQAQSAAAAEDLLGQFEEYTAAVLERAPNSSPDWLAAAERYQEINARTGKLLYLEKAIKCYRTTTRLYPNSATCHGRLALALLTSGDTAGSREEAATALWLDDQNPHPDKKLNSDLRKSLERIDSKRN